LKNHFELFGLTPSYALDVGKLDSAYREIQAKVHPDKFAHAGDAERRASMQMTTQVNEAYRTLKTPVRRAVYLLELNGVDVAFETDTAMPKDFLLQQMEFRERLEQAEDSAALDFIIEGLNGEKKRLEQELAGQFDSRKDYESARALVRKLMFFDRLAEEVDAAYETLEG
jgi:molecular chaperone HscB